MIHFDPRTRILATCFSAIAGFVDAIGFLMSGGFFVSFMSGNSTRMGIGLAEGVSSAGFAGGLILGFVVGVVLGASLGRVTGSWRRPATLILVAGLLALSVLMHGLGAGVYAVIPLALAMGAENTVFAEDGEVRVGLTYMTGTLVKLGKRLTVSLWGGDPVGWVPFLMLWLGLLTGAVAGALAFAHFGPNALVAAVLAMLLLAILSGRPSGVDPQAPPCVQGG